MDAWEIWGIIGTAELKCFNFFLTSKPYFNSNVIKGY